jgi:topoisomerase-4 subunit B
VNTQAVFSLRGKPLNSYGMNKKIVYENEEFNLLQAALDIEDDMENLRYNNIYCNGCRCRWNAHSLVIDYFFSTIFPELIKDGHLYILQTPLSGTKQERNYLLLF